MGVERRGHGVLSASSCTHRLDSISRTDKGRSWPVDYFRASLQLVYPDNIGDRRMQAGGYRGEVGGRAYVGPGQ